MARPYIKITPAMIRKCEKLASRGLTLEQIAYSIGISYDTLNKRKKDLLELSEAIRIGKAKGIEKVTNKLFAKATSGDNVSMIFYLKNRDPENWKEKTEVNQTTTHDLKRLLTKGEAKAINEALEDDY